MTFQELVRRVEVLVFKTWSTLPSRHIVMDLLDALGMALKCRFPQICHTSYSHFHDFPALRPDSRTFQAWNI